MAKYRCDLDDDIDALSQKFQEKYDTNFNSLVNAALKDYLIKKLTKSEIKDTLNSVDKTEYRFDNFLNSNYSGWMEQ